MIKHNDGWIFVGDKSNYVTNYDGTRFVKGNRVEYGPTLIITDNKYKVIKHNKLCEGKYEDPRIFSIGKELWVIMNCRGGFIVSMVTGMINLDTYRIDKLYKFDGDIPIGKWQKNWSPYNGCDSDKTFKIVYSINPWKLYEIDISKRDENTFPMKLIESIDHNNEYEFIMGGTPYVKWKDGWLSVGHQQTRHNHDNTKCRYYAHRFVYKKSKSVMVTDLFYIITKTMEYATSINIVDDDKVLLTLGIEDRKTAIVEIDTSSLVFNKL